MTRSTLAASAGVGVVALLAVAALGWSNTSRPSTSDSHQPGFTQPESPLRPTPVSTQSESPLRPTPVSSPFDWAALDVQRLAKGPPRVNSVIEFSKGYLALGWSADYLHTSAVWVSGDGRNWVSSTVLSGAPRRVRAARCGHGVLIASETSQGTITGNFSEDGFAWRPVAVPDVNLDPDSSIVGNDQGTVALLKGSPAQIAFSSDCESWRTALISTDALDSVAALSASDGRFVAVGGASPSTPVAWWSADGVTWSPAAVQARVGEAFVRVHRGSGRFVSISESHADGLGSPAVSFWTSTDGRSWALGLNPLTRPWGFFLGDGVRLVAYGWLIGDGDLEEWLSSIDGEHWHKLRLQGDVDAVLSGQARPFLLRDGVLFSDYQGGWIGVPRA